MLFVVTNALTNNLMNIFKKYWRKTVSFFMGTILGIGVAFAAEITTTPTGLTAGDISVLRASITASATTITLEPVKKWVDGTRTTGCFDTPSGFIIIEDFGGRTEWASYGTNACSSSNITTLTEVRRGLNPSSPAFTAGTGLAFDAGATVKVVDYPLLYNQSTYRDTVNTFTGSGQMTSNQTSQAWIDANCVTTAQRDSFTFVNDGNIICNSSTSTIDVRLGGQWLSFATGTGALQNATEIITGKVRLTGTGAIVSGSGSTGPSNVLWTNYVTSVGGTGKHGYIPFLDSNGFLNISVGGTGSGSLTQSGVLIGNSGSNLTSILPGTDGNVLVSNGDEWTSGKFTSGISVQKIIVADSTSTGTNLAPDIEFYHDDVAHTITGGTISLADTYEIEWQGRGRMTTGDLEISLYINDAQAAQCKMTASPGNMSPHGKFFFTVRDSGATGTAQVGGFCVSTTATGSNIMALSANALETGIDWTNDVTVKLGGNFSTQVADHRHELINLIITKVSR